VAFSINSVSPSISGNSTTSSAASFEKLSSGSRINQASDDAAGLAISQRMTTQLGGFDAAIRNSGDAISSIQVADGALESLNKNIGRIQELAIQSSNGALNDTDRQAINAEAAQLLDESNKILENTNFNGKSLLSSDADLNVQLDSSSSNITVKGKDLASEFESLGFSDIDLSTAAGASSAINVLKDASQATTERSSELGASSNRIESSIENLATSSNNTAEARSRIADADFAKVAADLAASQIRDQVQISVQAQANSNRDGILKLLS
jgi:flagellin